MAASPLLQLYRDEFIRRGQKPPDRIEELLSQEEKRSMMGDLANAGASGLSAVGWLLDTPGAIVRGGLSGGLGKAASALWETSDDRVSGRELLRQWGGVGKKDNWSNFGGGLATEVALDPLTYLSLGLGPLLGATAKTAAGKLAAKSGLMAQDLGLAAKKISEQTGQAIGKHQMLRGTADSVLGVMDDSIAKDIRDRMIREGGRESLKQPLAASHRITVPFLYDGARDLFGKRFGDFMARSADAIGTKAAALPVIGPAIRGAQALFDAPRMGFTDESGQWLGRDLTQRTTWAERKAQRSVSAAMVSAARAMGEDLFRTDGFANAVRDAVEGYADRVPFIYRGKPLNDLVQTVKRWQKEQIRSAAARGIRLDAKLRMPNKLEYMFRQAVQLDNPRMDPRYAFKGGAPYDPGTSLLGLGAGARKRRDYTTGIPAWVLNKMSKDGKLQEALRAARDQGDEVKTIIDNWMGANAQDFLVKAGGGPYDYILSRAGDLNDPLNEAAKQARKKVREMYLALGNRMRSMPLQHAEEGIPLYGSALNDIAMQMRSRARGNASADVTLEMLGRAMSDPINRHSAASIPGGTNVSVKDALKMLGFNVKGKPGQSPAEMALANSLGIAYTDLPRRSIPKQMVEQLATKVMKARAPREATGLLRAYDSFLQPFKSLALLWPSRYTRDMYSGSFAAATKGALDSNLSSQVRGAQIGRGSYDSIPKMVAHLPDYQAFATPGRIQQLRDSAPKYFGMSPEQLRDELYIRKYLTDAGGVDLTSASVIDDLGRSADGLKFNEVAPGLAGKYMSGWWSKVKRHPLRDLLTMFGSQRSRNGSPNWVIDMGDRAARASDSFNRIGAYTSRIRQGDSPAAAKSIADLTQVNYSPSAFTDFERNFMKRLFPFYSYTKGIAPLVLGDLVNKPAGLMGKSIRAITRASEPGEDTFVPEYLRQSAAIPIPDGFPLIGTVTPGVKRFLTNLDLPHEGFLNLLSPGIGNTLAGRAGNAGMKMMQNILGQSSPLIKAPLEYGLNRQFFTGRQLSDLYSMLEHDFGPVGRGAEQIISNAPGGSRILGTVRQLRDERITFPERLAKLAFNTITGMKVQDVDQVKTARLAARDSLNELLSQTQGVHKYENITIKPEDFATLSQAEKKQYVLYRILQAEAARLSREKKKRELRANPLLSAAKAWA